MADPYIPYSAEGTRGNTPSKMFCPHPFTNWCLNPNFTVDGHHLHTVEGFRKVAPSDSILEAVPAHSTRMTIYCLGGSTTYCTEVYDLDTPWPSQLSRLMAAEGGRTGNGGPLVVNGGVPGWGTLQSYIRLLTWGPVLRPRLTIVHCSKNDLSPLYQGNPSESRAHPDYGNLMGQFSAASRSWWRRGYKEIEFIYGGNGSSNSAGAGLDRLDATFMSTIKARHKAIVDLVAQWEGRVLFVPEFMRGGPYASPMETLHDNMAAVSDAHRNCDLFDPRPAMPRDEQYFLDKMHLSAAGCAIFAELLARYIKRHNLCSASSGRETA